MDEATKETVEKPIEEVGYDHATPKEFGDFLGATIVASGHTLRLSVLLKAFHRLKEAGHDEAASIVYEIAREERVQEREAMKAMEALEPK